jgi:hypothetical protein
MTAYPFSDTRPPTALYCIKAHEIYASGWVGDANRHALNECLTCHEAWKLDDGKVGA